MRRKVLFALLAAAAALAVAVPGQHAFGGPARSGSLLIAGLAHAL